MKTLSRWIRSAVAVGVVAVLLRPGLAIGHGTPKGSIGFDFSVVVDSQFIEITADVDLPTGFAVELRNLLDVNHDYQVQTPDEQQRLLWMIQAGDGPVSLMVDGKKVILAPLYNPKLRLSTRDSASLLGRGKLRASWFGYTPKGLGRGSRVEFRRSLWSSYPATSRLVLGGQDGLGFADTKVVEKSFKAGEEGRFQFVVQTPFASRAAATRNANPDARADTQRRMIPANAVQLAEALAQNYSHLLPADERQRIGGIHRRLRMGIQKVQFRRRADAETLTSLNKASSELVALLETCDGVVRLDLQETASFPRSPRSVHLPGDAGAFLLRVENGTGPHRGRIYDRSFDIGEFREPLSAGAIRSGVTWIMARITDLPADPTILKIALGAGEATKLVPLRLESPKAARLKMTVLSDDDGQAVPAMVSLRWKTCNLDRRPATALDLVPQFGGQGRQTSLRSARLTGLRGKGFWVVSGPFEMDLPPGEWEVTVRRGPEHSIESGEFTLKPGERLERVIRPRRWINMPEGGWYSGDDHVHSRILSDADARNLLTYVAAEDIHLANIVKMGDINRTFFQQRGHGKDYRVSDGLRVLVPGQECPRTHEQLGHTLAMNTKSFIRDTSRYYLYDTVFDEVHRQGGFSGYAHINRDLFFVHRDMSMNIPRGKVDFGEILQFGNLGTDLYYEFLNLGYPLTASAGSDLPWGGSIGEVRVYAQLGKKNFSADNWFEAFGKGHTFVSSGPMLELDVEGALPGDTVELDEDRSVQVRARLRINPQLGAHKLELIAHGEAIKSVTGKGVGDGEIVLNASVPVTGGLWLALRGRGADGSLAHTTPVYLARRGMRFWKMNEVETLIAKRLSQLAEIEGIVATARKAVADGTSVGLIEIQELAEQGDQLLDRVRLARGNYATLRKTYETELKLR
jgi:hypothetical protein